MAALSLWRFDSPGGVQRAAATLARLSGEGAVVIHGAATVTWASGSQEMPRTRRLDALAEEDGLGTAFWGLLFGLVFFVPLLGAAVGTPSGALAVSLRDVGIDDVFVNRVRDQVTPGTSALFLLSPDADVDTVRDALDSQDPPELIVTTLTEDQHAALREVFAD
jgi:uncharacterized membrane protein